MFRLIFRFNFRLYRFAHFLHIVAPSDEMFDLMVPDVYWNLENVDLIDDLKKNLQQHFPRDCKNCKSSYKNSCDKIKRLVNGTSLNAKRVLMSTVRVPTPVNSTLPNRIFFTKTIFFYK